MRDPLISTQDLAAILPEADVRVVDASWFMDHRDARAAWRAAHIPGAVFFDIDGISDTSSPLPHMLPSAEMFAREVQDLGLSETNHIVVYHQPGAFSAARVWWTFRAMGALKVQVLDGGMAKWLAEDRPVESGPIGTREGLFQARRRNALVRDFEQVGIELGSGAQVLDARSAERFRGEAPEPREGLRSGHMPGARNLPFGDLFKPDGTMKDKATLEKIFTKAGIDPARPVTTTCGSGITAAILALALARLGNETAAVYDGSWTEWASRADAEVVTGAA